MDLSDRELIEHFKRAFGLPAKHPEVAIFRKDIATPGSFYWIVFRGGLPYLEIDLGVPAGLDAEAAALDDAFVAHRDGEYEHRGWRSVCLRGLSATQTQGARTYGYPSDSKAPYAWCEPIVARAPATSSWLTKHFHDATLFRVRYMALDPDGYVAPHQDWKLPSMIGLNVALNMPAGCSFTLGGRRLPMRPQTAFMLDLSNVHTVANESAEVRYHLILHGLFGGCSSLRAAVESAYRHSSTSSKSDANS